MLFWNPGCGRDKNRIGEGPPSPIFHLPPTCQRLRILSTEVTPGSTSILRWVLIVSLKSTLLISFLWLSFGLLILIIETKTRQEHQNVSLRQEHQNVSLRGGISGRWLWIWMWKYANHFCKAKLVLDWSCQITWILTRNHHLHLAMFTLPPCSEFYTPRPHQQID